jgi:hypothetical protein
VPQDSLLKPVNVGLCMAQFLPLVGGALPAAVAAREVRCELA